MSAIDFAKQNNLYYENIAAYLNELQRLGYAKEELDGLKHVIGAAHSLVENGQTITNALGHLNELYASFRERDNFAEHNKDHRNNIVGMTLASWLNAVLVRKPTLPEITVAVGVLSREKMIASSRPDGDSSMLSALTSSALASFWGDTIRSSTLRQLNVRKDKILQELKRMSDDGRMDHLRLFVESSAARKLQLADREFRPKLLELVHGATGRKTNRPSEPQRRPAGNPVSMHDKETQKRDRVDLPDTRSADPTDPDGFSPGKGELSEPEPHEQTDPVRPDADRDSLRDIAPHGYAGFASINNLDIERMADEVFSSLTLDDWAVIPDDDDPFDGRDPFEDGVKWVPGLAPPPAMP